MIALGSNRSRNSGLAVEAIFSVEAVITLGPYWSSSTRLAIEAIFSVEAVLTLGSCRTRLAIQAISAGRAVLTLWSDRADGARLAPVTFGSRRACQSAISFNSLGSPASNDSSGTAQFCHSRANC